MYGDPISLPGSFNQPSVPIHAVAIAVAAPASQTARFPLVPYPSPFFAGGIFFFKKKRKAGSFGRCAQSCLERHNTSARDLPTVTSEEPAWRLRYRSQIRFSDGGGASLARLPSCCKSWACVWHFFSGGSLVRPPQLHVLRRWQRRFIVWTARTTRP